MGFEELLDWFNRYYRQPIPEDPRVKQYAVTLAPTDYNLQRALEVYRLGVTKGLFRRTAVTQFFGYRYRRMENFLHELNLYVPEMRIPRIGVSLVARWIGMKYLCKPKGSPDVTDIIRGRPELEEIVEKEKVEEPIYYKVKVERSRERRGRRKIRKREEKTELLLLDVDIYFCKPLCKWRFKERVKEIIADKARAATPTLEPLIEAFEEQWDVSRVKCDAKFEPCSLIILEEGKLYMEMVVFAKVIKCVKPEFGGGCTMYPYGAQGYLWYNDLVNVMEVLEPA